ncbi:MAG: hypothetical protein ABN483_13825, partial [Pantoea agglomerans]
GEIFQQGTVTLFVIFNDQCLEHAASGRVGKRRSVYAWQMQCGRAMAASPGNEDDTSGKTG